MARRAPAFALVEVVLALGIVAFALTAILGLFSVALNSSKASMEDTMLVSMTDHIMTDLRARSFTNIPATAPPYFFDVAGTPLSETNQDFAAKAIYRCEVTTGGLGATNALLVALKFGWPVVQPNTPAAPLYNNRTVHASVAGY